MKLVSKLILFLVFSVSVFCPQAYGSEQPRFSTKFYVTAGVAAAAALGFGICAYKYIKSKNKPPKQKPKKDADNEKPKKDTEQGVQLTSPITEKKQDAEVKGISEKTTFNEWRQAIDKLPKGLETGNIRKKGEKGYHVSYENVSSVAQLSEKEFRRVLQAYSSWLKQSSHADSNNWLGAKAQTWIWDGDKDTYFEDKATAENYYNLQTGVDQKVTVERDHFVQKLHVTPQDNVILHGDLHGDVHSLVASLQDYIDVDYGFKLKDPNTVMLFLGDYVDKGLYGFECLYTLLRLKSENPDRVFFVRGNHEAKDLNEAGFLYELGAKKISEKIYELIQILYTMLPVSFYLGYNHNYMQCTHGGWEKSYNPKEFLNSQCLYQKVILPGDYPRTHFNGFMWNDFQVDTSFTNMSLPSDRGGQGMIWNLSKHDTLMHLKVASEGSSKLMGILRAHQHGFDDIMNIILNRPLPDGRQLNEDNIGIAKLWTDQSRTGTKLWHGIVVTFNVCPHTVYRIHNDFDFDAYGVLKVADSFDNWNLMVQRKTTVDRTKVKIVEHESNSFEPFRF